MKRRALLTLAVSALLLTACSQSNTDDANTNANDTAAGGSDLLQRINNNGTINVGTEGTYPPFTYHDETGKLTGYDVEVTRAVADKLGVEVEFKETQWDAMLAGLDSKRFDMVANQVSLTTPERMAKYDKSTAYSWSGAVVLAPTDDNRYGSWEALKVCVPLNHSAVIMVSWQSATKQKLSLSMAWRKRCNWSNKTALTLR